MPLIGDLQYWFLHINHAVQIISTCWLWGNIFPKSSVSWALNSNSRGLIQSWPDHIVLISHNFLSNQNSFHNLTLFLNYSSLKYLFHISHLTGIMFRIFHLGGSIALELILLPKRFLGPTNFGSNKIVGPITFCVEKKIYSKEYWVKKNTSQKKFQVH